MVFCEVLSARRECFVLPVS